MLYFQYEISSDSARKTTASEVNQTITCRAANRDSKRQQDLYRYRSTYIFVGVILHQVCNWNKNIDSESRLYRDVYKLCVFARARARERVSLCYSVVLCNFYK